MKAKSTPRTTSAEPLDDDIRAYAYHLYQQDGCVPEHALDNWLEAKACILANLPRQPPRNSLPRRRGAAPR